MAKKKSDTPSLIETFNDFKESKNIDRAALVGVLEDSFRSVIAKLFGTDENYDVIVNPDKGDCEIYRNREVVADDAVEDPNLQIPLSEARQIDPDYEEGEEVAETIDFSKFGRRAILTLRQTLASKIMELEHDALYAKYTERIGEIVKVEVYQTWRYETLLVDEEGNEILLPKAQQIPRDYFHKGDMVSVVIDSVNGETNVPKIYASRVSPLFLQRLLENEIPEIADGLIMIRGVARIPGERAKVAVESYDERIDPVGACVGVKGSRINGIVRELQGESIDVIPYTANTALYIQRALSPAEISSLSLDEENKKAEVFLRPDEVSLAIGRGGTNIKLASSLTGYTIDVFREVENEGWTEDIYLDEFSDEVDQWVLDAIKGIGLRTAMEVLNAPREMLIEKADLEEDTVDNLLAVLRAEFEGSASADEPASHPADTTPTSDEAPGENESSDIPPVIPETPGTPED